MKIIIFVPGDRREVRDDEYYLDSGGDITRRSGGLPSCGHYVPLQFHEIEAPEGMDIFTYSFRNNLGFATDNKIILSRPKVKKWIWRRECNPGIPLIESTKYKLSEKEAQTELRANNWVKDLTTEVEE